MFDKFKEAWNEKHDPSEGNPLKIMVTLAVIFLLAGTLIPLYFKVFG